MKLEDLQRIARAGHATEVARFMLGDPTAEIPETVGMRSIPTEELGTPFPSSYLNVPADSRWNMRDGDLEDLLRSRLDRFHEESAESAVSLAVEGVVEPATPMEEVAVREYREILRDVGGRNAVRRSTASSMKVDPRNSAPCSGVVTRNRQGDLYDEEGELLSEVGADAYLSILRIPE